MALSSRTCGDNPIMIFKNTTLVSIEELRDSKIGRPYVIQEYFRAIVGDLCTVDNLQKMADGAEDGATHYELSILVRPCNLNAREEDPKPTETVDATVEELIDSIKPGTRLP